MPTFSYLAMPNNGGKARLCAELASLAHCRIFPADNHEVVILVTSTPDQTTEEILQEKLRNLPSLQSLNLAFGADKN